MSLMKTVNISAIGLALLMSNAALSKREFGGDGQFTVTCIAQDDHRIIWVEHTDDPDQAFDLAEECLSSRDEIGMPVNIPIISNNL